MELLEAGWDAGNSSAAEEDADHLHACINRLSPHARAVIRVRYTGGLSGARVAETLQIQVQSVYIALACIHRALDYSGAREGKFPPRHAFTEDPDRLASRWVAVWQDGIDGNGNAVRPGFIKRKR